MDRRGTRANIYQTSQGAKAAMYQSKSIIETLPLPSLFSSFSSIPKYSGSKNVTNKHTDSKKLKMLTEDPLTAATVR